jgi:hypothetical protein
VLNLVIGQWDTPESHKRFFDELAKELKFSPTNKNRWYSIDHEDVRNKQVTIKIITIINNKLPLKPLK